MELTLILVLLSITAGLGQGALEKSSHDADCTSDCETASGDSYYSCSTEKSPNWKKDWDYCSPSAGVDYKYLSCANACAKYGTNYYWCRLHGGSWGYCSPVTKHESNGNTTMSSYGAPCKDKCDKHGYSYVWCNTARKVKGYEWDYCSPSKGKDYKNNDCANECGNNGEVYKWCRLIKGGWGYC